MAETPEKPVAPVTPAVVAEVPAAPHRPHRAIHEVRFTTFPKLLFIWPVLIAGFLFWPLAHAVTPKSATPAEGAAVASVTADSQPASPVGAAAPHGPATPKADRATWWLGILGWAYVWILIFVILTLGVDIDRNQAAFWILLVVAIWILGLWLRDVGKFTFFGDIYRWFEGLHVQYDPRLGLALSVLLLIPYLFMILWARLNSRWRITHNEFEHYAFGKTVDSLGRGAKTIRTTYPDVFEMILGLAGTLIVYNASGTKELRRIPHVMFLPVVRSRLNEILERTAITAGDTEEEEEEDNL